MSQETSIQKAPSGGEQGAVVEEQHSAVEEVALCSTTPGGTPAFGGPPLHHPICQSGYEAMRLACHRGPQIAAFGQEGLRG